MRSVGDISMDLGADGHPLPGRFACLLREAVAFARMTMGLAGGIGAERRSLEEVHGSIAIPSDRGSGRRLRRFFAFLGPAYLVSVGYMDPGNWATDLQGGARFGYALIWVLLMSNLMAILLQTLAAQAGGRDGARPGAGLSCRVFEMGRTPFCGCWRRWRSRHATWPRSWER